MATKMSTFGTYYLMGQFELGQSIFIGASLKILQKSGSDSSRWDNSK